MSMDDYCRWPPGITHTMRDVRKVNNQDGLLPTIDIIAGIFGFQEVGKDSWYEFKCWCRAEKVDFTLARGPYVMTILKAMAAKRGRVGVSTLSSE